MRRKSVNEVVENPEEDEFYILVTRYYPKKLRDGGLSVGDEENPIDFWDRDLAPSEELLKRYKENRIDWATFREMFLEETTEVLIRRKIEFHEKLSGEKEPVLVCVEEESEYPRCHTWIILEEADSR